MKKALIYLIYEVYKNINPIWRKRALYLLGTVFFLILVSGALVFYAGYKTIHFALTQINNETALVQNTENLFHKGQKSLQKVQSGLNTFNTQACLQELHNSTGLTYWVQGPILDQIQKSWKNCTTPLTGEPSAPHMQLQKEPEAPTDWN